MGQSCRQHWAEAVECDPLNSLPLALGPAAQWLHPRASATYMDENFVGRIAHAAKACAGGVSIVRLGNIVLAKCSRGLFLRWTEDLVATARH